MIWEVHVAYTCWFTLASYTSKQMTLSQMLENTDSSTRYAIAG